MTYNIYKNIITSYLVKFPNFKVFYDVWIDIVYIQYILNNDNHIFSRINICNSGYRTTEECLQILSKNYLSSMKTMYPLVPVHAD